MGLRKRLARRRAGEDPQPHAAPELDALSAEDRAIVEGVLPYTMTGVMRVLALIEATRYCIRREIPGAFAECGVWRGGSILAMIATLEETGSTDRDIYLYDTFEGMTAPTERDVSPFDGAALSTWREAHDQGERPWSEFFSPSLLSEDAVRQTVLATGYPADRVHFIRGPVEETLPGQAPAQLALLRLDTDWYESTRHEMQHLYPRLASGGVLIVDDYGHWVGARQAVDEYFSGMGGPLLSPIDYTGRIAVKP
jgi:O-methyltransferase